MASMRLETRSGSIQGKGKLCFSACRDRGSREDSQVGVSLEALVKKTRENASLPLCLFMLESQIFCCKERHLLQLAQLKQGIAPAQQASKSIAHREALSRGHLF